MIRNKNIWKDIKINDRKAFLLRDLLRKLLKRIITKTINLLTLFKVLSIGVKSYTPETKTSRIVHVEA